MSSPPRDSFVSMDVEAGPSEPQKTPVPVGAKLALIEVASILIIGITSYTIGLDFDFEASKLSYSLAVGVVSLVTCLVARAASLGDSPILAAFLTFWWLPGTGFMTFYGPYNNACTGYFAAWMGLIGSLLLAFPDKGVKSERRQTAAVIGFSSVVLLIAVGYDQFGKYDDPSTAYGLSIAVLSIFLSAALGFVTDLGARRDQMISAVLALMWVSGAIFMAWDHHGNALFSLFAAMLCSVKSLTRSVYRTSE